MYNLSENQKEALRWIVQKIYEQQLGEEFECVFLLDEKVARFKGLGEEITEDIPITKSVLKALNASELLLIEQKEKFLWSCVLLNNAYSAVGSNFEEISSPSATYLSMMFYIVAMAFSIVAVFVVFLTTNSLLVSGFVLFASLLVFLAIGIFQLRRDELISEKSFVQLAELVIKQALELLPKQEDR